jgi:hypothetical protein
MVIHILMNIPKETRRSDGDYSECNGDIVYPLVALRKGEATGTDNDFIRCFITGNSGDMLDFFGQRDGSQFNGLFDEGFIENPQLEYHRTADVKFGIGDEFVLENVIVGSIADTASDDADGKGESSNSRDEIL